MITIFESKDIEYPEKLNKPVRYDVAFLKDIASKTGNIQITNEHTKEVLGVRHNFIYEDGVLKASEPNNLDLKGFGLSPVFECDLVDKGDYYQPINGVMSSIGLTKTPRNSILYNSIENVGDNMANTEALATVIKEKEELQKRIGVLENESKSYKNMLKAKDDEISQIKKSYESVDTKLEDLDELREKAELYDNLQVSKREELLEDVCGGNEELKSALADADIKTLTALKDNPNVVREGTGVPTVIADDLETDGEIPTEPNEDEYDDESFMRDYEAAGWG